MYHYTPGRSFIEQHASGPIKLTKGPAITLKGKRVLGLTPLGPERSADRAAFHALNRKIVRLLNEHEFGVLT